MRVIEKKTIKKKLCSGATGFHFWISRFALAPVVHTRAGRATCVKQKKKNWLQNRARHYALVVKIDTALIRGRRVSPFSRCFFFFIRLLSIDRWTCRRKQGRRTTLIPMYLKLANNHMYCPPLRERTTAIPIFSRLNVVSRKSRFWPYV